MDEATKKAFETVIELAKQLITLSAAIIAVTVSLLDPTKGMAPSSEYERWLLMGAWGAYFLSLVFGPTVLMAAASVLQPKPSDDPPPRNPSIVSAASVPVPNPNGAPPLRNPLIWDSSIRVAGFLQIISFLAATILAILYGISRIYR